MKATQFVAELTRAFILFHHHFYKLARNFKGARNLKSLVQWQKKMKNGDFCLRICKNAYNRSENFYIQDSEYYKKNDKVAKGGENEMTKPDKTYESVCICACPRINTNKQCPNDEPKVCATYETNDLYPYVFFCSKGQQQFEKGVSPFACLCSRCKTSEDFNFNKTHFCIHGASDWL